MAKRKQFEDPKDVGNQAGSEHRSGGNQVDGGYRADGGHLLLLLQGKNARTRGVCKKKTITTREFSVPWGLQQDKIEKRLFLDGRKGKTNRLHHRANLKQAKPFINVPNKSKAKRLLLQLRENAFFFYFGSPAKNKQL